MRDRGTREREREAGRVSEGERRCDFFFTIAHSILMQRVGGGVYIHYIQTNAVTGVRAVPLRPIAKRRASPPSAIYHTEKRQRGERPVSLIVESAQSPPPLFLIYMRRVKIPYRSHRRGTSVIIIVVARGRRY